MSKQLIIKEIEGKDIDADTKQIALAAIERITSTGEAQYGPSGFSEGMMTAFAWELTQEGSLFWEDIYMAKELPQKGSEKGEVEQFHFASVPTPEDVYFCGKSENGNLDGEYVRLADYQKLIDALEEIQLAVCYACEENIDSKEDMLHLIGEKARKALGQFEEREAKRS